MLEPNKDWTEVEATCDCPSCFRTLVFSSYAQAITALKAKGWQLYSGVCICDECLDTYEGGTLENDCIRKLDRMQWTDRR